MRNAESKSLCSKVAVINHSINVRCTVFVRLEGVEKLTGLPPMGILRDKTFSSRKETGGWKGNRLGVDKVRS